jgi:hypothetical protein
LDNIAQEIQIRANKKHEQKHVFGRFGNFHKGVTDDSGLLGCDAMSMIKWFLSF